MIALADVLTAAEWAPYGLATGAALIAAGAAGIIRHRVAEGRHSLTRHVGHHTARYARTTAQGGTR